MFNPRLLLAALASAALFATPVLAQATPATPATPAATDDKAKDYADMKKLHEEVKAKREERKAAHEEKKAKREERRKEHMAKLEKRHEKLKEHLDEKTGEQNKL